MFLRYLFIVNFLFTAILLSGAVLADTLVLKNGDRLTGTVKSLSDSKLVFETSYAGEISIDWDIVESLSAEGDLQIDLASGESLTGKIEIPAPGEMKVATAQEVVSLDLGEVAGFGPIPEPVDYGIWDAWHGGVNFGFALSKGNTDVNNP